MVFSVSGKLRHFLRNTIICYLCSYEGNAKLQASFEIVKEV